MHWSTLRHALLSWFATAARDLPWRHGPTPYQVWISEIMLQQTRVEAVITHYRRFLERFPEVQALAAAPLEAVLAAWSGLGYYRRARLLYAAAQQIVAQYGGNFPCTREAVLALPGIGRYTAGAILSLAFGQPEPLVDGNVERVLARWLAIPDEIKSPAVQKRLWALATTWVQEGARQGYEPRALNQALMELGATLCTPRQPDCERCPVKTLCLAYTTAEVARYPVMPKRTARKDRRYFFLLIRDPAGCVLLRRRPQDDRSSLLPAGLWELPHVEWPASCAQPPLHRLQHLLGSVLTLVGETQSRRHSIMDWRVHLVIQEASPEKLPPLPEELWRWFPPPLATEAAQASATRKLLQAVLL